MLGVAGWWGEDRRGRKRGRWWADDKQGWVISMWAFLPCPGLLWKIQASAPMGAQQWQDWNFWGQWECDFCSRCKLLMGILGEELDLVAGKYQGEVSWTGKSCSLYLLQQRAPTFLSPLLAQCSVTLAEAWEHWPKIEGPEETASHCSPGPLRHLCLTLSRSEKFPCISLDSTFSTPTTYS